MNVKVFVRGTLIAAIYFALTVALQPVSYGHIQIRISEILAVLPYFFPESIAGLTVGCILANLFSPFGLMDVVFGALCTLIAAILTYSVRKIKKPYLGIIPPILINALGVGLYLSILTNNPPSFEINRFFFFSLTIAIGEAISVGIGGSIIITYLLKRKKFSL
ncbi:MAG: QueT transporter family protein [Caldisericia bacterium]|nr:QueT transporter family protein [Caldisericia bacterium]MDD5688673.1 QueT transporter family protein [Caldisericia bacterium]HOJ15875.1 QueT transporter family protein [Caldisericia bacterium]HOW02642.1 QueT transporter family protein [Caldisericia bacterium]HQG81981.1 QueT transporter family protein [Caldisericia bacterium]